MARRKTNIVDTGLIKSKADMQRYIDANETGKGGFNAAFLKTIGVDWPPRKGWKQRAIESVQDDCLYSECIKNDKGYPERLYLMIRESLLEQYK